jgi:nucleoside-diphosphate-sugar epimerase
MPNLIADDLEAIASATGSLWEELRGNRIFITGGTGFFGCWLLESFLWANDRLGLRSHAVVLTRDPKRLLGKAPHLARHPAIQLHPGDVRDFCFPAGGFTHVIHAATEASAELNSTAPSTMLDTNVRGTSRCLEFAAAGGAKKFLLTSSGSVYGTQPSELTHLPETFGGGPDPLSCDSAYAEGKRMAELQCALAARGGGFEIKIARGFAFVGPYMRFDAHFAIGNFIRDQAKGQAILVKGDGTAVRSYLYASDLMVWLWTILFRGRNGRAYNVGSERAVNIAELAAAVAQTAQPRVPVEIRGRPSGLPPQRYVPSTERARHELGLKERVSLEQAIHKTRDWCLQSAPGMP